MEVLGEIDHRLHRDQTASGWAHHSRTCSAVTGPRASCSLARPPAPRTAACSRWTWSTTYASGAAAAASAEHRCRRWGGGGVGEVEGGLVAGEVADRLGPAYVKGVGRAEEELGVGIVGDGGLEVEGVGEVDVPVDPDPARHRRHSARAMSKCPASAAACRSASSASGSNLALASSINRASWAGPTLWANDALCHRTPKSPETSTG